MNLQKPDRTALVARRVLVTVAIAVVCLIALSPPAAAHSAGGGTDATNFQTRFRALNPTVPGLDIEVIENGSRVQLTNTTGEEVVVLGYQEEPYLRVGPDGLFENRRSPATYLNQDRQATTPVPGSADPKADPKWEKISDGQVARWHDHRVHWMGEQDPPAVRRAPDRRHVVIPDWVIPIRMGDTTIQATGDLVWVPGPSPWPWVALAVGLFAATVVLAGSPAPRRALAAVVAVLVGIDMAHALGVGFAGPGSVGTQIGEALAGSYLSVVGWVAGVVGVVLLVRRRIDGLYLAAFAGGLIALNGGVADLADLSRSQLLFAGPPNVARAAVAVSLGLGGGMVAAAVLCALRGSSRPDVADAASGEVPAAKHHHAEWLFVLNHKGGFLRRRRRRRRRAHRAGQAV
ncbi:MAG: hypothetical protein M3N28_10765 [Actinomycetota bacterium]|nr:hypothetical protein [Actinomycetota bacterium]